MRLKKRKLFEDLYSSGARISDPDYRDRALEYAKRFLIVNEDTVSKKTLDEIDSEVLKFVVRVRKFWYSKSVSRHLDRMPLDHDYFAGDITIVVERETVVDVPVPVPAPQRAPKGRKPFEELGKTCQFAAAAAVRESHDSGAILKASYRAARDTGQVDLAKVIKQSAIDPNAASKAVDGLTAESK